MSRWSSGLFVALAAAGVVACSTADPGAETVFPVPAADPNIMAGPNQPADECVEGAAFAPARVWLLSDEQYVNVVRDVFGVTLTGADTDITTGKSVTGTFTNLSEGLAVGSPEARSYERAAAKIAPLVVANLSSLVPACATLDAACIDELVRDVVARAWRRPLTDIEKNGLAQIYTEAEPDGAKDAAALVIEAVLESGSFLYRTEIGTGAVNASPSVTLSSHEMASALSFMLLDSVPDAELRARADDGSILSADRLAEQVARVMALPAARAVMTKKVSYWAGAERIAFAEKDTSSFPEWTPTLRAALYQSAESHIAKVVSSGTVIDLLAPLPADTEQEIVSVYGTGARGAGLLTHPGILAATNHRQGRSDPIHRGLYIYEQYVCAAPVPGPPPNANAVAATMVGTERELAAQRAKLSCGACHARFDPMGLTTEAYDSIGRYQPNVDSSARIEGIGDDLDGPVASVEELVAKLKTGRRVADCLASSLEKYSLGYSPEAERSCALRDVKDAFAKTGSFADFFRALVTSPGFLIRDPGEVK